MAMEISSGVTSQIMELKTSSHGVTRKEEIKTGFKNVDDYSKYLQEKYSYMNTGKTTMQGVPTTVVVSEAFLRKCKDDPEKAAFLEENLAAIPNCAKMAVNSCFGTLTNLQYMCDANGNLSVVISGTNDPDGKIVRENAKKKAEEEKAAKAKVEKKYTEKTKTETAQSSKDKIQEYYEKLCKKFPQINFNTKGGVLPSSSSKVTVNLSQDCLKKMANDPDFAKEVEWNLSGEEKANALIYSWAKRDGIEIYGKTVTYDANGNRESSYGMRTANAGNGNNINKLQKKYKEEEERRFKIRKKREEKEKLEKKKAEKKAEEERLEKHRAEIEENKGEYTVSVVGADIKTMTQQLTEKIASSSYMTDSFDAKV